MTKFEKGLETTGKVLFGGFVLWVAYRVKQGFDWAHGKTNGVGAVKNKRRIFSEIADLQKHYNGLEIGAKWNQMDAMEQNIIEQQARKFGFKPSSRSSKSMGEQYYNSLRRSYNSVAGTTLPARESVVYNELGDPIVIYRDYGTDSEKWSRAVSWFSENYTTPYDMAVLEIADGAKLVWSAKKPKYGVKEQIFPGTGAQASERKARISYLSKNGMTPEGLAHKMWEGQPGGTEGRYDTQEMLDGLCEAMLNFTSVGQCREYIMNRYIDAHKDDNNVHFDPEDRLPF